jgi:hypothetical protein
VPSDWERVAADPALLASVRARYPGRGDVLDQLWWAEHPGAATPAGVEDPAAALARTRQALYRPGAAIGDADRVGRAEAHAADDRAAALEALRAADVDRPARASVPPPPRASRAVLAGVGVAALLVGAAAGFSAGRLAHGAEPAALQVFDRAQREADRPPASVPSPVRVRRSTLREIGSASTSGTVLYGARATDGRICLLAVVLAADAVATCTSESAFAASGLSLGFETRVDPVDDAGPAAPQQMSVTWSPDGRVRF